MFQPPTDFGSPWGLLGLVLYLLALCIFFRAILSWIQPDPTNPIIQILDTITEPILAPLRQVLPRFGMFDISPMVAMIVLFAVARLLSG